MMKYNWEKLNNQQIGTYAEYFVKMEFTMYGFQVYSTEVDDRGIDFVVRKDNGDFYKVQVKARRKMGYFYIPTSKVEIDETFLIALLIFKEGQSPDLFLIPTDCFKKSDPILIYRDYEGKKSAPEIGIKLNKDNLSKLIEYDFNKKIHAL